MSIRSINLATTLAAGLLLGTAAYAAEVPDFANFSFANEVMPVDVQEKLQALGFTNVGSAQKEGDVFTADAQWEGRPIMVHVDADTGWIRNNWSNDPLDRPRFVRFTTPADVTEKSVEEQLTRAGFTNVSVKHDEGDVYNVDGTWAGQVYDMTLNVDTGALWDVGATAVQMDPPDFMNVSYPDTATPSDIGRKLAALGYTDIGEIEKSGMVFETTAAWHGDRLALAVDAGTGQIRTVE